MSVRRNLVIGLDGTWNDAHTNSSENGEAAVKTNVARLIDACPYRPDQYPFYESGVGTAYGEEYSGGLWGDGLDAQILAAYRFLRQRLQDSDTDYDNKIFVFGFSRGAYAARRLCGLLSRCGVTRSNGDDADVWRAYESRDEATIQELEKAGRLTPVDIEVLGVWDTVKSTNDPDFDDYVPPARVKHAYHAMAIDERRKSFGVLKFKPDERATQTWFCGVHSDVGGGYEDQRSADITLRWMSERARAHGLKVAKSAIDALQDDPLGPLNESYKGFWTKLGEYRRTIDADQLVHDSVYARLNQLASYKPPNLPNGDTRIV